MKKFLLFFILLIPFYVFADSVTLDNVKNISADYILKYNNSNKFIYNTNLYGFNENGFYSDADFINSGLLNIYEYNVIGGRNSYLYDGLDYFTMSYNSDKTQIYKVSASSMGSEYINISESSGVRYTNFAKPKVKVTGEGSFNNPWVFILSGYSVSYNLNYDNAGIVKTDEVYDSDAYTLMEAPSRDGYIFVGWNLMSDGTGDSYSASESFNVVNDTVFYAIWQKKYTVMYDANGGTGGPGSDVTAPSDNYVISSSKPAHTDSTYGFKSWNTKADGSGVSYNPGSVMAVHSDVILYAQYAPYIARIDNVYYFSISEAVNAVNNNNVEETITMVRNTSENVSIANTKRIVLDLNSLTVTGKMINNGTISVKNGTLTNNNDYLFENNGTLNVISGTYTANMNGLSYISTFKNNGTMNISGGNLGVDGYYDQETSTYYRIGVLENSASGIINITGGNIGSESLKTTAVHNFGKINMSNGNITVHDECGSYCYYGVGNGELYANELSSGAVFDFTGGYLRNFTNYADNELKISNGTVECDGCSTSGTTSITGGTFIGGSVNTMLSQYNGTLTITGMDITSGGWGIINSSVPVTNGGGILNIQDTNLTIPFIGEGANDFDNVYAIKYTPAPNTTSTISNVNIVSADSGILLGSASNSYWGPSPVRTVNLNNVKVDAMGFNVQVGHEVISTLTNCDLDADYFYALMGWNNTEITLNNTTVDCSTNSTNTYCAQARGKLTMNTNSRIAGGYIALLSSALGEDVVVYDDDGDEWDNPPGIAYLYLNSGTINGDVYGIAARATNMYFDGVNVTGGTYGVLNNCDYLCYLHRYSERLVRVTAGSIYGGKYGLVNSLQSEFYNRFSGSQTYSMNSATFGTVRVQGGSVRGGTKGMYNTSYDGGLRYYKTGGTVSP